MSKFLNPLYENLEAYTPGEQPKDQQYIKLNTNESPYPPSPEVMAVVNEKEMGELRLYSDPQGSDLCRELGAFYGLEADNVFLSNGSDDILNFAFMAFAAKGAKFPDITYSFYPVYGDLHHVPCNIVPVNKDFSLPVEEFLKGDELVVITNPNAPTGMALSLAEIEKIVKENPDRVVLIDEAYVDFGTESAVGLISKYDNILVVMTYSKSRSLAGARLGFALGHKELIADLNRLKFSTNPYNVNRLSLKIGIAALKSHAYFAENCQKIMDTRTYTVEKLEAMGFTVLPSTANFIFVTHPSIDGGMLYETLKSRGILIRHFTKESICQYNRVTIGTREEMEAFLLAVAKIKEEVGA